MAPSRAMNRAPEPMSGSGADPSPVAGIWSERSA